MAGDATQEMLKYLVDATAAGRPPRPSPAIQPARPSP